MENSKKKVEEEKPSKQAIASRKNGLLGGRPVGSLDTRVLARKEALDIYKDHVSRITEQLAQAQVFNALGNTFLVKREKKAKYDSSGKKVGTKYEYVNVEDPKLILEFLNENDGADSGELNEDYYFMTTKKPDNKAIDSLLDRTHGKPQQTIVTSDSEGNVIPINDIQVELNQIFS